jgi:hypothetical protein
MNSERSVRKADQEVLAPAPKICYDLPGELLQVNLLGVPCGSNYFSPFEFLNSFLKYYNGGSFRHISVYIAIAKFKPAENKKAPDLSEASCLL